MNKSLHLQKGQCGFLILVILLFAVESRLSSEETRVNSVFKNSLGLSFVEVEGTQVFFSTWETRVSDYRTFARSTGRSWKSAGFSQSSTHPAVNVSWEDATQFCRWLTKREIASNRLQQGCRYRLPTSAEWSLAVGLAAPSSDTFSMVIGPSQTDFPWNGTWPPGDNVGNYHPNLDCDNYTKTSPVGSFTPNTYGIYDMGGNVWEWCADSFKNSIDFRILRGASWRMRSPGDLLSSLEIGNVGHIHLNTYGFRIVLEPGQGVSMHDFVNSQSRSAR